MKGSVLLVWLLLSLPCIAQEGYRHITIKNGLSQGSINTIFKDSRGFIWLASQAGLNRYDGSNIKVYQFIDDDSTTIGGGDLRGVVEDANGDLWIGSGDCLNRFNRKSNNFTRFYSNNSRRSTITTVFYANKDEIWYINEEEGIMALNYKSFHKRKIWKDFIYKADYLSGKVKKDPIRPIVWILLPTGVVGLNYQTKEEILISPKILPNKSDITSFELDAKGNVWGVSGSQLWKYSVLSKKIKSFKLPNLRGICPTTYDIKESFDTQKLVISGNYGLVVFDLLQERIGRYYTHQLNNARSLSNWEISTAILDDQQILWANPDPVGIDVILPQHFQINTFDSNPCDFGEFNGASIRGITEDQEHNLWVGSIDEGIWYIKMNPNRTGMVEEPISLKKFTTKDGLPDHDVNDILIDANGIVWVATFLGMAYFDKHKKKFIPVLNHADPNNYVNANYVREICRYKDNQILLSTMSGLFLLKDKHISAFSKDKEPGSGSLYYDASAQRLYVGWREKGLAVYSTKTEKPVLLPQLFLQGLNVMECYRQPNSDILWISSNKGLIKFDVKKLQVLRAFTDKSGLINNVVYAIMPFKNSLWLSTNKGVAQFDLTHEKFKAITQEEFREYNRNASLKASNGTIYFGSTHGLTYFNPLITPSRNSLINIYLTDMSVNDKPLSVEKGHIGEQDKIILNYDENTITLSYVGIDYSNQISNTYFVQLEGFDKSWMNVGSQQSIRYTHLPYGEYKFKIKVKNLDNEGFPVKELVIVIKSPFWRTIPFYLASVLLLIFCGYIGTTYWVNRKLLVQQHELETILKTQESERKRLAQDLHDDLGGSLSILRGRLSNEGVSHEMIQLVNQAIQDLRLISWNLLPPDLMKDGLVAALENAVERIQKSSDIKFTFIHFGKEKQLPEKSRIHIYRIVLEVFNNILKHSKAHEATMQLIFHEQMIYLSIEDNGIGINEESSSWGIGFKNIQTRVDNLQAQWHIDTSNLGTTFILAIPYE